MVTPDKDFGQLVNEHVLIYRPARMGDGAEILGVPEVLAKWGIKRADQVRDILGLWGDTSDNIPGVPGVGEKTAQKLIAQYDSLENALDHFAEQKGKLKESLEKFRDQALLSKRLATIDVNVPLPFEPEKLRIGPRDDATLRAPSSPNSNSTPSAAASSATASRRAVAEQRFRRSPSALTVASTLRAADREATQKSVILACRRITPSAAAPATANIPPSRPSPSRSAPSTT